MKKIKSVYITLAYVCAAVFSLGFVLGIFMHWLWFLAAAAGVGGYVFLLWKYLRCPYCGRWLNLYIPLLCQKPPVPLYPLRGNRWRSKRGKPHGGRAGDRTLAAPGRGGADSKTAGQACGLPCRFAGSCRKSGPCVPALSHLPTCGDPI